MTDLAPIRNAPMLEGLAESHIAELGAVAAERQARGGERLFSRGEAADTFYIVKDGTFALTVALRRLGSTVELGVEEKRSGDALGWSALVAPHQAIYSCFCTEDGSLISFSRAPLERLLSADSELGGRFLQNLGRLVGDRVRAMQDLWIDEIQHSMARVNYWTHAEVTTHVTHAIDTGRKEHRASRRLFGRGSGSPPPAIS